MASTGDTRETILSVRDTAAGCEILAISTSEIKISVIIDESFTLKAVKKLHSIFNLD